MKVISSKFHGVLDYVVVVFLFLSPTIFKMTPPLSTFTYTLCWIHFALTVFTNFELGVFKVIPFRIHGLIELIVSVALAAVAIWFNSIGSELGFYFYICFAVAILIVFLLTNYSVVSSKSINKI